MTSANATHNRAGEITFKQISDLTYEVTLITYTDSRSMQADRPQVDIKWGDNTSSSISRQSQSGFGGNTYTLKNVYVAQHTYPAGGKYIIQFLDPNRIEGINNIANSVNVPFYIETELVIDNSLGYNESPLLLQPPIDYACPHHIFLHNPNAFDPDGDSLAFSLIAPKRDVGIDVPGYQHPPASFAFKLDPYTGELVWDAPTKQGIYNIAILIEEFRNHVRIGYVIRDMQIIVQACNNNPPKIEPLKDTCVEAGTNIKLEIAVKASDPDSDKVTLSATGGPFLLNVSPAFVFPAPAVGQPEVTADLSWTTDCKHIRKQPYRIVFRAVDNDPGVPLSDLKHMDITIVGPAPKPLQGSAFGNGIRLEWQKPPCSNVVGYIIYRRSDSSKWEPGYCETGVPASTGFKVIDTIADPARLDYYDDNNRQGLSPGIIYCHRVTAIYISEGNYEFAEGYASNEVCAKLIKDVPVLTHASVEATSPDKGKVLVAWSSPNELDTLQNPGPYKYELFRGSQLLRTYTSDFLGNLEDTVYLDTMVNTVVRQSYKISFHNTLEDKPNLIGSTIPASTIFLQAVRRHEKLELLWSASVPWTNYSYVVYKKNDSTGAWDSLTTTNNTSHMDTGLVNGQLYCYKVKGYGSFHTKGFIDPIVNFSQEYCNSPRDTIPPCQPRDIQGEGDCDVPQTTLLWTLPEPNCSEDVGYYRIYYSPLRKNSFSLIDSVIGREAASFTDIREILKPSMAGCYYVTAVDTYYNESEKSSQICVDNCPLYELPNVFTPNGDSFNDLLNPLDGYRFIADIHIQIFNRWGEPVFETTDPEINWDGTYDRNGKPLPDGVYYYLCQVNMIRLDGNETKELRGVIHILR